MPVRALTRPLAVLNPRFSAARLTEAPSPHARIKMRSLSSRKLAIGATGVLLLGGAGGALAATQSSSGSGRQAYVDDLAKRLNVSPSALTAAAAAARNDQIEAALAAGRITQSQADALKQ